MPFATTDDGVRLHYEETGSGSAGDLRARVRRRPSQLGAADAPLRQAPPLRSPSTRGAIRPPTCRRGRAPIRRRARRTTSPRCSIISASTKAHVVGLSMGGFATLHFGFRHPGRALLALRRRLRLRRRARRARALPRRGRGDSRRVHPLGRHGGLRREIRLSARRACSSRTRTRAASPSSRRMLAEHSAAGLREHAARRAARAALALRPRRRDEAALACRR